MLINSAIFRERECENPAVFLERHPEIFENSLIPLKKSKIKIGFIFDRGRGFIILLNNSVHSLLNFERA